MKSWFKIFLENILGRDVADLTPDCDCGATKGKCLSKRTMEAYHDGTFDYTVQYNTDCGRVRKQLEAARRLHTNEH